MANLIILIELDIQKAYLQEGQIKKCSILMFVCIKGEAKENKGEKYRRGWRVNVLHNKWLFLLKMQIKCKEKVRRRGTLVASIILLYAPF